jgi:hypothetical protein
MNQQIGNQMRRVGPAQHHQRRNAGEWQHQFPNSHGNPLGGESQGTTAGNDNMENLDRFYSMGYSAHPSQQMENPFDDGLQEMAP